MRTRGLLVAVLLGIALILVGIVVAAVPLLPHNGKTIGPGTPFTYHVSETVPILPSVPVVVSWSSTSAAEVVMWICTSFNGNASTVATQCTTSHPTFQNGTSGSSTESVPVGDTLVVTAQSKGGSGSPPSVSISLRSTSSTIGFGLLALGVIVLIVGIILTRGPTAPESEGAPAMEESPVSSPEETGEAQGPADDEPLDAIG